MCIARAERDGTRAETRIRLSSKRTSPFKSVGASFQSTVGSRGVRIGLSNDGYTTLGGGLRVLATHSIRQFPLHFPSRESPCATRFRTSFYHAAPLHNTFQLKFCLNFLSITHGLSHPALLDIFTLHKTDNECKFRSSSLCSFLHPPFPSMFKHSLQRHVFKHSQTILSIGPVRPKSTHIYKPVTVMDTRGHNTVTYRCMWGPGVA